MNKLNYDVIIVGGGVLGITLAYHLASRKQDVLVLEREKTLGMHASGKNAGMIRQLYRNPQLTEWTMRSIAEWPVEIKLKTFVQSGSYILGRQKPAHHNEIFEERELNGKPAVYAKNDGLMDSGLYMQKIYKAAISQNAQVKKLSEVIRAYKTNSKWHIELSSKEVYQANLLVNAAGAWINSFIDIENQKYSFPTQPYARHLFEIVGWDKDFMPASNCGFFWDEINNYYMRKWEKSSRLVSICDQSPADPDSFTPDSSINERLAEIMCERFPTMAPNLRIATSWHCFRTYTEDQMPIWGPDSKVQNLFWLAAFGGYGMSTSYAATLDAARLICGENVVLQSDFSPQRFQKT